ncbi:S8 family serine peptidase, partial [Thermodesulfobacteriota bacterium]
MKSPWGKLLIVLAIALLITPAFTAGAGALSTDTYRIRLRSFEISPPSDHSYLIDKAADEERDRSIEYIQFWEIPDPALRKTLAKQGIELLRYVSGNAYFASIPHGVPFDSETLGAIRWAGPVAPEDKIHPRILNGQFAPWSSAGGNQRFLLVQFHPNMDIFESSTIIQSYGGEVLSTVETVSAVLARLPVEAIDAIASDESVQWIEEPLPPMSVVNSEARTAMNVDALQEAPYSLDGSGVQVLVYDGGMVESTHQDFGDRVIFTDDGSTSYHATHVAGTIAGDGTGSEGAGGTPNQWRGMATAAEIISYEFCCTYSGGGWLYTDPGDIEVKYDEAINVHGADLSNNSIGTNTAPNGYNCDWEGDYGATAILIDNIVRGSLGEPFRIVWSAGNERGSGRCGTTYHTTAPPANAKNHISVGAANSNDDSMTDFSSWGPTDDGRLKPDISGPGCQEGGDGGTKSTSTGNSYSVLCGTSMSGPAVAGTVALLVQDWRVQYDTAIDPLPSTVKALLAHEAEDHGNTGPDYQFGYGIVQARETIDRMRAMSLVEDEIDQGDTNTYYLIVQDGDSSVKVSLAWDDYPGTANSDPVLVNDLDLVVTDPEGTRHYPWTLDPANPADPAVRTSEDHKNNIEQVSVQDPLEGLWTISVVGIAVPEGPQTHSVVFTPDYTGVSSFGVVSFDAALYACEATVGVLVSDLDLLGTGQVDVSITTSLGDAETLTLYETVADTGIFEATIPLTEGAAFPGDGALQGADSQTLDVLYIDLDDGIGGVNVSKTDTSVVDCVSPVISAVAATGLTTTNASISWLTDENADSTVYYGDSIPPDLSSQSPGMMTSHSVGLEGLTEATRYYFSVESTDPAGNTTLDNNGGDYYSFVTPFYMDSFTDDMEGGAGDWTHAGGGDEWELGAPTYASGPSGAHSGDNCWGTDLDNTHENGVDASLVSGTISVTEGALLTFWHWYYFESCCDQGMVEVSDDDGATWSNITPGGEYNSSNGDWTYVEIDLAGYSGEIMVRFRYTSDGSVVYAGWYIDDVEVKKLVSHGVYYSDDVISDALPGGDGDGYAEPGETIDAAVTLMGLTEETALGVTATLSTIDPYATITQDTAAYGDIEPGTQAAGSVPFTIAIDPATPIGSSIKISVEAEATNGGPWWSEFTLHVYSVSTIGGTVSDLDTSVGIDGANVFYDGPASGEFVTNESGEYLLAGLESGTYLLHAEAPGYSNSAETEISLPPDAAGIDFSLGA